MFAPCQAHNRKELNFKFQLVKGRIAENLVQELFLSEGYQVFKYGVENNYPYLLQEIKGDGNPISLSLRITPDLIIFNPNTRQVQYVEVKYCASGEFELSYRINPEKYKMCFPSTVFFIITNDGFFEVEFDRFLESRFLNLTLDKNKEQHLMRDTSKFDIRPECLKQYEDMAQTLFANIPSKL
ncbi:MAG: hypothetical protein AAF901_01005 [Bacteroidota bacterium]